MTTGLEKLRPRAPWLAGLVLILAVAAAYQNSLFGPFVFDDLLSIRDNPSIRHLWPPGDALLPPGGDGRTVEGRPLLNLSFALNHAISGLDPWSYHLGNLAIHAAAALALFGLARRLCARRAPDAAPGATAFAIALLWALHPLQTAAVAYVVQRAESLAALLYLFSLYAFARGAGDAGSGGENRPRWLAASVFSCALGMATKETMVSAPLAILACDRVFFAGGWREAWRRRRGFYLALAGSWLVLGLVLLGTGATRGGTVGLRTEISAWHYALTQLRALSHYLKLVFWPEPLVFDHGTALATRFSSVWPQALLLLALAAGSVAALVRGAVAGWLGFCFFALLAPSSSVVPIATQTMAEHRMYLASATVVAAAILALRRIAGPRILTPALVLALPLAFATRARNDDYQSALRLYAHTVRHRPDNPRAFLGLAAAWEENGRPDEARENYTHALRLDPGNPDAHNSLGNLLLKSGDASSAVVHYRAALRSTPDFSAAHYNLARALFEAGDDEGAIRHFRETLRRAPDKALAHSGLGAALIRQGRIDEAATALDEALRLDSGLADAHNNLGILDLQSGRLPEARIHFEKALRLSPRHPDAAYNLGTTLLRAGETDAAILCLRRHLALRPAEARARSNLAVALARSGRLDEALQECEAAVRLAPDNAEARENLAALRALRTEAAR